MELKEEYKNLNIETILLENVKNAYGEDGIQRHSNKIQTSTEAIKKNNWEQVYIALYLILDRIDKENIKISIASVSEGIIDKIGQLSNNSIFTILALKEDGTLKDIVIAHNINDSNINKDSIVIEISEENKEKLINTINNICTNWKETFIIRDDSKTIDIFKKFEKEFGI